MGWGGVGRVAHTSNLSPQGTAEDGKLDTGTPHRFLAFSALLLVFKINSSRREPPFLHLLTWVQKMEFLGKKFLKPGKGCRGPSRGKPKSRLLGFSLPAVGLSGILYKASTQLG